MEDLGDLEEEEWMEALMSPRESAITARFRLVQLKILHRVYYTPTRLAKMGKSNTGKCNRGCGKTGTFYHIIWDCPKIRTYWTDIQQLVATLLGMGDVFSPKVMSVKYLGGHGPQ